MKFKLLLLVTLAIGLLAAPQALAGPRGLALKAAKAECRAELSELGRAAFREKYGRHPARSCMRANMPEAVSAVKNASQECRAEREADPDAFRAQYGTNENKRNAFGKCVSGKTRENMAEEPAPEAP